MFAEKRISIGIAYKKYMNQVFHIMYKFVYNENKSDKWLKKTTKIEKTEKR